MHNFNEELDTHEEEENDMESWAMWTLSEAPQVKAPILTEEAVTRTSPHPSTRAPELVDSSDEEETGFVTVTRRRRKPKCKRPTAYNVATVPYTSSPSSLQASSSNVRCLYREVVGQKLAYKQVGSSVVVGRGPNRFGHDLSFMGEEDEEQQMMMNAGDQEEDSEWIKMTATMDSGSAEHALPSGAFQKVPLVKGDKVGKKYLAANGEGIVNEGEKTIKCVTDVGIPIEVKFQVAKVCKPLISARKLSKSGHKVVLEEHRPRIISPQGFITPLRIVGGVYVIDLWVKRKYGDMKKVFNWQ